MAAGDLAPTIFAAPPLFGRAAADLINWNSIKEAFKVTQDKGPTLQMESQRPREEQGCHPALSGLAPRSLHSSSFSLKEKQRPGQLGSCVSGVLCPSVLTSQSPSPPPRFAGGPSPQGGLTSQEASLSSQQCPPASWTPFVSALKSARP